jgi:hypothetical protein
LIWLNKSIFGRTLVNIPSGARLGFEASECWPGAQKAQGPRTEVSSGVLGQNRLRALPPCFVGKLVHGVSRFTPVDGSLPCFANLASTQRQISQALKPVARLDLDQG